MLIVIDSLANRYCTLAHVCARRMSRPGSSCVWSVDALSSPVITSISLKAYRLTDWLQNTLHHGKGQFSSFECSDGWPGYWGTGNIIQSGTPFSSLNCISWLGIAPNSSNLEVQTKHLTWLNSFLECKYLCITVSTLWQYFCSELVWNRDDIFCSVTMCKNLHCAANLTGG